MSGSELRQKDGVEKEDSFALKQMQKYGWSEGKGLGAKEGGITVPVKPCLKFDKHGLGHDITKDIGFNWWDNVFNKALNTVGKSDEEQRKIKEKEKREQKAYKNFVQKGEAESEDEGAGTNGMNTLSVAMVTECEGRTAHKGARHGVYSSGKLERVKKAEAEFLERRSRDRETRECVKEITRRKQKIRTKKLRSRVPSESK